MTLALRSSVLALGLALALPAAAGAATATITNDVGKPTPLSAPTKIRNMSPIFGLAFDPSEKRYAVSITGPAGTVAAPVTACTATSLYDPKRISYLGNGTYTAAVTTTTDAGDVDCASGQTSTFQFEIAALAAIAKPTGKLLTRRPGSTSLIGYGFPVGHNPGSEFTEVRYARGVRPQADGSLPGTPPGGLFPVEQPKASLGFGVAGRYAIIVRPRVGQEVGPWSAPVYVTVLAPFDFAREPVFTDARGPVYKIRGTVREKAANGRKITISLARGAKGGKFTRLRTVTINQATGRFAFKLSARKRGRYRLRYAFGGTKRVAKGTVTQRIRIKRVVL